MVAPITLEDMHELAKSRGLRYLGSSRPKSNLKELWECSNRHVFPAIPQFIRAIPPGSTRTGCYKCHGSSRTYSLADSKRLGMILMARGLEVVGEWRGAKNKNTFRCRCCGYSWDEFAISILYNPDRKCRKCFPLRQKMKKMQLFPPQRLLPYYPQASASSTG